MVSDEKFPKHPGHQEDPAQLGRRHYTLPLMLDWDDPECVRQLTRMEDHLTALRVQQWARHHIHDLRKIKGVEAVKFSVNLDSPSVKAPKAKVKLEGVRSPLALSQIKDLRVSTNPQSQAIAARVDLAAVESWMDALELWFPCNFNALQIVDEAFASQGLMDLETFERRIVHTLPPAMQAEVEQVRLDQALPPAVSNPKPRM